MKLLQEYHHQRLSPLGDKGKGAEVQNKTGSNRAYSLKETEDSMHSSQSKGLRLSQMCK